MADPSARSGPMPALAADPSLLLPGHLRLPDLSATARVTAEDLDGWIKTAHEAFAWGPDERNGARRQLVLGRPRWVDERGAHSPDEWTPATIYTGSTTNPPYGPSAYWFRHGQVHRDRDQPGIVHRSALAWTVAGERHRPHAPALLHPNQTPEWIWDGLHAPIGLTIVLHRAWTNHTITDRRARDLLEQAAAYTEPPLPVRPEAWVAHVLAANPSRALSPDLRRWLSLLTA